MKKTRISQKVAEKISKEKYTPKPRWYFATTNTAILIIAVLSAIIGSFVISIIIHVLLNRDWFVYLTVHRPMQHLLSDLPLIWILLLIIAIFVAYFNVEHSKSGYRYSPYLIILGSLLLSVILGVAFNSFGLGEKFEKGFARAVPPFKSVEERAADLWIEPFEGHLGGEIVSVGKENLTLKDDNGKVWKVTLATTEYYCHNPLSVGKKIKIIGKKTGNDSFYAIEIHDWLFQPKRLFRPQSMLLPARIN